MLCLEITSISPSYGSTEGSTIIKITGNYLYHSDASPANISIAGKFILIFKVYKIFIVPEEKRFEVR